MESLKSSQSNSRRHCMKIAGKWHPIKMLGRRFVSCAGGFIAFVLFTVWMSNFMVLRTIDTHYLDKLNLSQQPHDIPTVPLRRNAGSKQQKVQRRQQKRHQTEEEALEMNDGYVFHIVFSSGCNALQDWQSYSFFYQVMASGFTGNVTRVASCETDEAAESLQKLHIEQIFRPMSNKFRLHTTPDYSHMVQPKYNFFNKPFGIQHWMTHGLKFPQYSSEYEKTIFVLMDPDQFLLRPFKRDMSTDPEIWSDANGFRIVGKGQPMAAKYGFGGQFFSRFNISELLALPGIRETASTSGLLKMTMKEMDKEYNIGAPYVVQASDFWNIVNAWVAFVVPVYEEEKQRGTFMAEMHAYCFAAAHFNLRHETSLSFMISDPENGSLEAWSNWIDKSPEVSSTDSLDTDLCSMDYHWMPHTYHYCHRLFIGPYFFSKYQVPKTPPNDDFMACQHPLYQEPPHNVMDLYSSSITLDGVNRSLSRRDRRRMAFGVCQVLPRLNAASAFYKKHHCSPSVANFSKVFVHETHENKKLRLAREKANQKALKQKR